MSWTSGRSLLWINLLGLVVIGLYFLIISRSPDVAPSVPQSASTEAEDVSPAIEPLPVTEATEEPIEKTEPPPSPTTAKKPVAARRLMVFTPSGPLLLDLAIQIEGSSHKSKIRQFVDRLRKAADADADGKTTWTELIANQSFLAGPLGGGGQQTSRTDRRRWRELFDVDGDGRVDRGEALAWFDREATGGKIGLTLLGQRAYTPSLVSSATWRTLDADSNGSLSADEITGAPARLLSRDVNDDFVVVPAELLSLTDLTRLRLETGPGGNRTNTTNDTAFQAAMLLDREADTRDARNTLARMRVGGGGVYGEGAFGVARQLFGNVDTNANRQIGRTEWALLRESPPHARFTVRFPAESEPRAAENGASSLVLEEQGIALTHEEANQSVLTVAAASEGGHGLGGQLLIAIVDETSINNTDSTAEPSLADSDAQVRQRLSLTAVVNDAADPLFAALDRDGDGRLGEREMAESGNRLAAASQGKGLRPGESPWLMRLTIYRTTRQLMPTEAPPARSSSLGSFQGQAKNLPVWFTGADTNRDGDLSRREFFGSSDRFAELDTNRDGFLSADEALRR